jgi:MFS family permease
MLLYLFGAAAIIVATIFISKTARENGRSGLFWALVTLAVGFGSQIVLPVIGTVVVAVVYLALGTSQRDLSDKIEAPAEMVFYVLWLLSFVFLFLVLRFVANNPVDAIGSNNVPPPPNFDSTIDQ